MRVNPTPIYFREIGETLSEINEKKVYRAHLGNVNYANDIKPEIDQLLNWLELADEYSYYISEEFKLQIKKTYEDLIQALRYVTDLTDDVYVRDFYTYKTSIQQIYTNALSWYSMLKIVDEEINKKDGDKAKSERLSEDIQKILKQTKEEQIKIAEAASRIDNIKSSLEKDISNFNERYKDTFSRAELLKQEDIFTKAAENNKRNSVKIMYAIVIVFIALLGSLIWFIYYMCFSIDCLPNISSYINVCPDCSHFLIYFYLIKSSTLKLLLLSVLIYMLKVFISLYRAQLHNQTVNNHKANSFAAALALFDKLTNETTREKILIAGCESIFKHINTGFINKSDDSSDKEYVTIIEKLMSIIGKEKA